MKRITISTVISLVALGLATPLLCQAAMGETERAVEAMEQKWMQAQSANNVALEATYLADTIVLVDWDGGKVRNKDQYIAEEKVTTYTHVSMDNLSVHAYGTAAVASYVYNFKGTGAGSKPFDMRVHYTDTWVKMPDGKRQCVASVGSPLKP